MKRIETRTAIHGTATELWDVLMDFQSYSSWNPMVVAISGEPARGAQLTVRVAVGGRRPMTFRPTVVEYEPKRRFAWLGQLLVRGVFDGLHRFEIEERDGATMFVHSEEFRGLLPPFVGKVLRDTHASIAAMDQALAREVVRRRSEAPGLQSGRPALRPDAQRVMPPTAI